jgi:hypothetical protein
MSTSLILLSLIACGSDPVLEAARAEAEGLTLVPEDGAQAGAERPLGPTGPAGRPEKSAPPTAGKPADPGPGKPGEPAPGVPDEPPPGGGSPGGLPTPEGPTTLLKGTIEVQDYSGGPVMIDAFDGDHKDLSKSKRVSLVSRAKIDTPGAFEIAIPEGGKVWISAYNDINGDGRPSREEPFVDYGDNPVFADQGKRISLSLSTQHGGKK